MSAKGKGPDKRDLGRCLRKHLQRTKLKVLVGEMQRSTVPLLLPMDSPRLLPVLFRSKSSRRWLQHSTLPPSLLFPCGHHFGPQPPLPCPVHLSTLFLAPPSPRSLTFLRRVILSEYLTRQEVEYPLGVVEVCSWRCCSLLRQSVGVERRNERVP